MIRQGFVSISAGLAAAVGLGFAAAPAQAFSLQFNDTIQLVTPGGGVDNTGLDLVNDDVFDILFSPPAGPGGNGGTVTLIEAEAVDNFPGAVIPPEITVTAINPNPEQVGFSALGAASIVNGVTTRQYVNDEALTFTIPSGTGFLQDNVIGSTVGDIELFLAAGNIFDAELSTGGTIVEFALDFGAIPVPTVFTYDIPTGSGVIVEEVFDKSFTFSVSNVPGTADGEFAVFATTVPFHTDVLPGLVGVGLIVGGLKLRARKQAAAKLDA